MNEKKTILYVDDEPLNLMLFEVNFKRNFNVITSLSGFDALEKLNSNPEISIVVSDMKMPKMNGIEFITHAKKSFSSIYYFILTGLDESKEIVEAIENKLIQNYFCKPINMKIIEQRIEEAIVN